VKFWQHLTWVEIDQQIECARFAEEVGFDGVMHGDHFCFPEIIRSRFPMSPDGVSPMPTDWAYPDLWVLMAAQAAVTTRLRFAAGIYTMATRHPVVTAKATGTLALLSCNRAIVGVAPGWMKEEFDVAGIPFERRGARLDEAIEVTRKLWGGGAVEHHGEFYDFPPIRLEPMPGHAVPVYIGGSGEAAWQRAGRLGDGWMGGGDAPEDVPAVLAALKRCREEAGRAHLPFETVLMLTRPASVDELKRLHDQGLDTVATLPFNMIYGPGSTLDQKKRDMETFARDYISAFA
jgi:probable F420-dependent oxidoreductase